MLQSTMYEDIINALPGLPSVYKATHVFGMGFPEAGSVYALVN